MLEYVQQVTEIESAMIGDFGFKSLSGFLLDGTPTSEFYTEQWSSGSESQARLSGRTPAHFDRDRVIYSDAFRAQDDKYHTLYFGMERRSRNYTTHALRAAQIGRTTAQRLRLNVELTEAIILASKVGSVPFVHRGREVVAAWMKDQVREIDRHQTDRQTDLAPTLFRSDSNGEMILPDWIDRIDSPSLKQQVQAYLPWADGNSEAEPYSSGIESYWTLTTNSFLRRATNRGYMAESMYGAWRHSLDRNDVLTERFEHRIILDDGATQRVIARDHATHEAVLSRYCDDITWVLENLSEAARVAAMANERTVYAQLAARYVDEFDSSVIAALGSSDSGKLYTYFVDDLVKNSLRLMGQANSSHRASEIEQLVALGPQAMRTLKNMKAFLRSEVFENARLEARNHVIDQILRESLTLLYDSQDGELSEHAAIRARAGGWDSKQDFEDAREALSNPVIRLQASVDLLTSMSDREVFNLIGME